MIDLVLPWARQAFAQLGLGGVSVVTVVVLRALVLYTRRAATVGGLVVGTASQATRDAQVVALALLVLILVGLIHPDLHRANDLLTAADQYFEVHPSDWWP